MARILVKILVKTGQFLGSYSAEYSVKMAEYSVFGRNQFFPFRSYTRPIAKCKISNWMNIIYSTNLIFDTTRVFQLQPGRLINSWNLIENVHKVLIS